VRQHRTNYVHVENNDYKDVESKTNTTVPIGNMVGWECPKCGKVYAPWVRECSNCGNKYYDPWYLHPWRYPYDPYDPYRYWSGTDTAGTTSINVED